MPSRFSSLASPLVHDVGSVFVRLEEQDFGVIEKARRAVFPGLVALGEVVHEGGSVEEHGIVVRPLGLVGNGSAVGLVVGAVKDLKLVGDEANLLGPVVDLDRPVGILLLSGVASKAGAKGEGASVRDGVLVVVPVRVLWVNLPLQTSSAGSSVPAPYNVL